MYKYVLILLIFMLLLTSCAPGSFPSVSLAASGGAFQATPVFVTAPQDATPTPTPFQPLPPTPLVYPTGISMATPTSIVLPSPTPTATLEPTATPTLTPLPEADEIEIPRGRLNILLLGSDQREGDPSFRTDTIILAVVHLREGKVNLVSFPRDLYVTIPYWGQDRINTAWQHGGFDSLAATLDYNFGVKPDHYVLINFHSFNKMIDSLGGIDVNVTKKLVAKRQGRGMVEVPVGINHMNGKTALWYVRSRKETNDFDRGRRQQEVITAIASKVLSADGIRRAPELYEAYKGFVETDLTLGDIIPLLPAAARFTDDPASRINSYFIGPGEVWDWISPGGGMVLLPNQPAIMEVLRKAVKGE